MATYLGHQEDSNGNILLPTPHSMAARVELGTTASQAYTIGTYLIFNNRLCKATTAIASGDTLAIGTNLVQCSIGSELSSHLQANSNEFYFDYHDGKYGYNTNPLRSAETFKTFGDNEAIYNAIVARGVTPASDSTEDLIAAIALIDTKHSVSFQGHYAGSGSGIEYWVRVDGSQVSHGFWTDGNGSTGVTV